jgi:tRNA(adenine34) deaminase
MPTTLTAADRTHLRRAGELAAAAERRGNRPFGAVIVGANGETLAAAENSIITDDDIAAHAEINAVRQACRAGLQRELAGATIYASAEPCPMCAGAILRFRLSRIVYGRSWQGMAPTLGAQAELVHVASRDVAALAPRKVEVIGPCDSGP